MVAIGLEKKKHIFQLFIGLPFSKYWVISFSEVENVLFYDPF